MRKYIYLSLLLIGLVAETQAIEIINLNKSGGGPNGYAKTAKSSITVDAPGLAGFIVSYTQTDIVCSGSGYDQCPGIVANKENYYDAVDESYANHHIKYADLMVSEGKDSGTYSIAVQVAEESKPRIYRVDWTPSSNGGTSISVYRDDI